MSTSRGRAPVDESGHPANLESRQKAYWRRNLMLTSSLLLVWFVVTFGAAYHARALNEILIFNFPAGFYMGAQGALIIYVVIIGIYARVMNRIDTDYRGASDDST